MPPETLDPTPTPRHISDHELLRNVGRGSYGEVWLARSVMGTYRAVKIVSRKTFSQDRPFEREFLGIQKFEPISRTHPGLVVILHVGRHEAAGYFYYVMELADDVALGQRIDPQRYEPKTLRTELARRHKLPLEECVQIGLALASAVAQLHKQNLIHRDIKPSNIIFVNGAPKFADVGLVADIGEATSFVGTQGYLAPEGPGSPTGDIFSLGKVLHEMAMGREPASADELSSPLKRWNEIVLKASDNDFRRRFQSAEELHAALAELASDPALVRASVAVSPPGGAAAPTIVQPALEQTVLSAGLPAPTRVAVLYLPGVQPDDRLQHMLNEELTRRGCQVAINRPLTFGVEWTREIENKIRHSDAVIPLLSSRSVQSEMLAYEVETAYQAFQEQPGKPRILPVRVDYTGPLPSSLASSLDPIHHLLWSGPQDDTRLVGEVIRSLDATERRAAPEVRVKLESIGGAVSLDSQFYVVRPTDHEFQNAVGRRDSIVLVKGARQMGKTSLLARGLQQARKAGEKVVFTDFQKLNNTHLVSIETFFLTLADFLTEQLDLDVLAGDVWDQRRSPNNNFERYLRREVLGTMPNHLVWALDEVDRLFTCAFGGEVFGLFRSWHNERALDPSGPWSRLTLVIAYATEAHLFITDVNQSPFNVGTRLTLDDFSLEQVADLNERHGGPLKDSEEIRRFFSLVGGQPYLVRRGLNEFASTKQPLAAFAAQADRDEGIFGDHLRRMLVLLAKDPELTEAVRGILTGSACPNPTSFYRLRSAGVMTGDSPEQVRPRCEIYASYLKRQLR